LSKVKRCIIRALHNSPGPAKLHSVLLVRN